jgi:hypothetical protein
MPLKEARMYVRFDYKCPKCGVTDDRFIKRTEMDKQFCTELKRGSFECGTPMVRLPAAVATTFKFADPSAKKSGAKK